MAFTASMKSGSVSSVAETLDHVEASQDDSEDEDEDDLQMAYNKLFKECAQLKKINKIFLKRLNDVEHENVRML